MYAITTRYTNEIGFTKRIHIFKFIIKMARKCSNQSGINIERKYYEKSKKERKISKISNRQKKERLFVMKITYVDIIYNTVS